MMLKNAKEVSKFLENVSYVFNDTNLVDSIDAALNDGVFDDDNIIAIMGEDFERIYTSDIPINYYENMPFIIFKHKPTETYWKKYGKYDSYESIIEYDGEWKQSEPKTKEIIVYLDK